MDLRADSTSDSGIPWDKMWRRMHIEELASVSKSSNDIIMATLSVRIGVSGRDDRTLTLRVEKKITNETGITQLPPFKGRATFTVWFVPSQSSCILSTDGALDEGYM